ncbi:hypothetical protein D7B24_006443 [Verticillium nonalfalfae]|uniref:Uncharacterized protein n=1 Tax=Verticillium nonalfalfae TaxID=1051616 RepID=A0A3M9Y9U2_9PEZI|nr:uncharacterized protein D7B24_006443 [Verticillium nonalfalfae]RNJ57051.1 hypothetical protein D7B24_006443 [Verticillium nonalfalfae]
MAYELNMPTVAIRKRVQRACESNERSQSSPVSRRAEKVQETRLSLGHFALQSRGDLLHLKLHEGIVFIAVSMQVGQNFPSFFRPIVLDEPLVSDVRMDQGFAAAKGSAIPNCQERTGQRLDKRIRPHFIDKGLHSYSQVIKAEKKLPKYAKVW